MIDELLRELEVEGKTYVVKAREEALESPLSTIYEDIEILRDHGAYLALVYGAQTELTQRAEAAGVQSAFISGKRITNSKEFIEKIFLPTIEENGKNIESQLSNAELFLYGVYATVHRDKKGAVDFGYRGDPQSFDDRIRKTIQDSTIAIIPPMGIATDGGDILNCNSDDVAAHLATWIRAEGLYFATDVDGIVISDHVEPKIGYGRAEYLTRYENTYVNEHLRPMIVNASSASSPNSSYQVPHVYIFNGLVPHNLLYAVLNRKGVKGTKIVDPAREPIY